MDRIIKGPPKPPNRPVRTTPVPPAIQRKMALLSGVEYLLAKATNPKGLHMSPCTSLAVFARLLKAQVKIVNKVGQETDLSAPMNVLELQIHYGEHFLIYARGKDARVVICEIADFLKNESADVITNSLKK